jgi:hypothetical protein
MLINGGKGDAVTAIATMEVLQAAKKSDVYKNSASAAYKYVKLNSQDLAQSTYKNYLAQDDIVLVNHYSHKLIFFKRPLSGE